MPGPDGAYAHRLTGRCKCGKAHGERGLDISSSEPVAVYRYGDFEKGRFEQNSRKSFAWRRLGIEDWPRGQSGAVMAEMPLYGADALTADGLIIFAEGEKAADALTEAGFLAVSGPGGAKQKDFGASLDVLRGRDVYLWADHDPDGVALMAHLAVLLTPIAKSLHRITWQDAPDKGDAYDALAAGVDVQALVDAAEPITSVTLLPSAAVSSAESLPYPIDWSTFFDKDRMAEDWLLEPVLPRGRAIATYSPPKSGKSLCAVDWSARLATGRRVLEQPAGEPVEVVYLDLEMTEDDLYERLQDMGYGPDTDLSHFHYYLLPSLPMLDTPAGGEALLAIARRHDAALVVIDTTARVLAGAENDADTLRAFYHFTGMPLKADGRTVWRLDHSGKDLARGQRGTSAKADDVDLVWELTPQEGNGLRLRATHRRQSWIPEVLHLVRLGDPLRHERAVETWPAGTADLAELLASLNVPLEQGRPLVRQALKDAGHGARNDLISAAIRYRKERGQVAGTGRPGKLGTAHADSSPLSFGDTLGDSGGQPSAANGDVPPSLDGDTPSPTRYPCAGGCGREMNHPTARCVECATTTAKRRVASVSRETGKP
ncbi:MAG TPA: AAA family ATPase [Dehalococcoidia bacterium]|nr:AAA family ATPase [Dehalococcoidia bacterium]